ncbi:MAG: hypothetical protein JNM43_01925 [Planctomycetaceae bacterium]|nr:hypothetical protein [Planctomycetaceae bacterium]
MKSPLDSHPYERDSRSREIELGLADGAFVFVQVEYGAIFVVPDGPHMHPKVLGNAQPAMYAGDLTIDRGRIRDLTNLSGTFRFSDSEGLLAVARALELKGFCIMSGAVRLFSHVDSSRPVVLR